jgi:GDPmannose 4,6-dehydratase
VTRRISEGVARIKLGLQDELSLGNLDARRDWGFAPEYVRAMWQMLQPDEPGDYVIGTGEHHTPREFARLAFTEVGLDPADFVRTDRALLRPAEVDSLLADPSKARRELGWRSETSFAELVRIMVEADLAAQERASGRRRGGPGTR